MEDEGKPPQADGDEHIRNKDVQAMLKFSRSTVNRRAKEGKIRRIQVSSRVTWFSKQSVLEYMNKKHDFRSEHLEELSKNQRGKPRPPRKTKEPTKE